MSFDIADDGSLEQAETYATSSIGDSDEGDFDGQSSIRIIDNFLLVVNAGENFANQHGSISVFSINDAGLLTQIDQTPSDPSTMNIDSGGIRPVSIDYLTSGGDTFVIVANQHSNPLCLTADAAASNTFTACTDQYNNLLDSSTNPRFTNSDDRNIAIFNMNDGGVLTPQSSTPIAAIYNAPDYGGPSQVSFSPSQTNPTVAVTLWGVPHFSAIANENLQMPSRTYLYDVSISNGNMLLSNERFYQQTGISGSIGFSYSSDSNFIYVANFNIGDSVPDYSVTALDTNDTSTVFISSAAGNSQATGHATVPGLGVEACWTWLTADNSLLLVPSFTANTLSTFSVDNSNLTHRESLVRRGTNIPDTKDVFVTGNGRFVYVLGALETHTISVYDYDAANALLNEQSTSPYPIPFSRPSGVNLAATEHAYLGLAGWPADYVGY